MSSYFPAVAAALTIMVASSLASGKELERASPESVGMSKTALAAMKAEMQGLVDTQKRAGIVYAVARNGKLIALEAMGMRDIEKNLPMKPDTIFRLASMSRVLTGATILSLIDDNKLHLSDPVSKYIPEFADTQVIKSVDGDNVITEPQKTPLSVENLFTYTSGLGYGGSWPKSIPLEQSKIIDLSSTLEVGIRRLAAFPLLYQPGEKWHYGFSGDVLGRVAEVASGQPLDVFLQRRMFDKIGMRDTHFSVPPNDLSRFAEVYGPSGSEKLANISAKVANLSSFTKPGTFFSAGGGLVSTVPDYLRFVQMLLNGGEIDGVRVLKAETVKSMLTRHTTPEQGLVYWYDPPTTFHNVKGYAWGLAIGIRADEAEHAVPGSPGDATWAGFINTVFFIDPKTKIVAVAMSQYLGPDEPVMTQALRKGVYAAIEK
jgi:CubicO group peptidase (beta-lactamase class C family)